MRWIYCVGVATTIAAAGMLGELAFPHQFWPLSPLLIKQAWPLVAPVLIAVFTIGAFYLSRVMDSHEILGRQPEMIPVGRKAVISFRGIPTGEIAESGPLRLPIGYTYELFDSRIQVRKIGPLTVQSADDLTLRATVVAHVAPTNPWAVQRLHDADEGIDSLIAQTARTAISARQGVVIGAAKEEIDQWAINKLAEPLGRRGFDIESVSIDVSGIPSEYTDIIRVLQGFKRTHPDEELSDLSDIIGVHTGRIIKTQTETKVEVSGLDDLLKALADRISSG